MVSNNRVQQDNFLHNVAWLRNHHGFSKKKMAGLLQISVYMLSKIERGVLPPKLTIDVLFCIQEHFKISPTDQFCKRL